MCKTNDKKNTLYIVVLNYNNFNDTLRCLESINKITWPYIKTILVDNNSNTNCVTNIEKATLRFSNVHLIKSNRNLGYAGGNNLGIRYAVQNGAEYVAIINNDVIVNCDSFKTCFYILKTNKNVAFVGPTIVNFNNNNIQYTGGYIDYDKIESHRLNEGKKYIPSNELIECDYVGGACIVFKTDIINIIGYMPEFYFLYWEEADWCAKAKLYGYRCLCTLDSFVRHNESSTVSKKKGILRHYMERNRVIFAIRNNEKLINAIKSILKLIFKTIFVDIFNNPKNFVNILYYFEGIVYSFLLFFYKDVDEK